jgi:hypothetical protein
VAIEFPLPGGHAAVVSDADVPRLSQHRWRAVRRQHLEYAVALIDGHQVLMHRFVLDVTDPRVFVDHIDYDGLNNARENLRLVRPKENVRRARKTRSTDRTSEFKGVSLASGRARFSWHARIHVNGRHVLLGTYRTQRKAAAAYNRVARRVFGEFAALNDLRLG